MKKILIFLGLIISVGVFGQIPDVDAGDTLTQAEYQVHIDATNLNTLKATNATHSGEVTGSGALTIADNIIEEVNLEATNSPTDNYILSSDAATGGFTWVVDATGGTPATADISDVSVTQHELEQLEAIGEVITISAGQWSQLGAANESDAALATTQDISDTLNARIGEGELGLALADTMLWFAPCIGVGNAGDTIAFTLNNVIWGAKWEGTFTLNVSKITGVVSGTSPDIDIAVFNDVNFRDGTPTDVLSADLTITSTTAGNDAISFSDATLAPGDWIWIRVDEATAKPTQCIINIYGYLSE